MNARPKQIRFWNGNKSQPRQHYEAELVRQLLSQIDPSINLEIDHSDRLTVQGEAEIFNEGFDLLITVAGNPKFEGIEKRIITSPLAFGILGCRIPIYRRDQHSWFQTNRNAPFKQATIGLPADWADVPIFHANGYHVATQAHLSACFEQVARGAADYLCLGANEVRAVFDDYGKPFPELMIATDDVLYYPMPLQFYCHGQAKALQAQLNVALNEHQRSGNLSALFEQHFSAQIFALGLPHRRIHRLHNPCLKDQPSLNEALSPLLLKPAPAA